jgi:hypothetical protein
MHPKGAKASLMRSVGERAVTGITIGRLAVSAYVPFHVRAPHLPAYMARACEIAARNHGD